MKRCWLQNEYPTSSLAALGSCFLIGVEQDSLEKADRLFYFRKTVRESLKDVYLNPICQSLSLMPFRTYETTNSLKPNGRIPQYKGQILKNYNFNLIYN